VSRAEQVAVWVSCGGGVRVVVHWVPLGTAFAAVALLGVGVAIDCVAEVAAPMLVEDVGHRVGGVLC
jgi:hypothetical protein